MSVELNFEGFRDLIQRVAVQWYALAKKEFGADMAVVDAYLAKNPFTAEQSSENEAAYEKLMDIRCKLFELSYEIDRHHDAYMEFMEQTLDKQDLLAQVGQGLRPEEKHLIYLELMIMEQVADWEIGTGRMEQESGWDKPKRLVVTLPNGTTKTVGISQGAQKRYWFGVCPVSSKIGNLKMCGGCKMVGYVGKEEQKEDWPKHKALCKILLSMREQNLTGNDAVSFLSSKLKRPLSQFEYDICNHPRVCMVCNKGNPPDDLKNCRQCFCVAFCPNCHESGKTQHDKWCKALKIAAEDYKNEQTIGHQVHTHVPTSRKTYSELAEGIEKFFVADVTKLVSNKVPGFRESELRYLTFLYTCPLTTLFGMQNAMMPDGSHIKDAQALTIHLVGVRLAEFRNVMGWEIIAHELPQLKHLTLVFIGDECPLAELPRDFTYKSKEIQQNRTNSAELRIRYMLIDKLYQDYATNNSYIEPDFVVALDCGFKFYPSWKKAIPHMVRPSGAALIFTEFNEKDCQDNLDIVQKECGGNLQIINPPQRNPFQSLRPVRCSDKSGNYEPHSVIYTNDFISVVRLT